MVSSIQNIYHSQCGKSGIWSNKLLLAILPMPGMKGWSGTKPRNKSKWLLNISKSPVVFRSSLWSKLNIRAPRTARERSLCRGLLQTLAQMAGTEDPKFPKWCNVIKGRGFKKFSKAKFIYKTHTTKYIYKHSMCYKIKITIMKWHIILSPNNPLLTLLLK